MRTTRIWALAPIAVLIIAGCGNSSGSKINVPIPGQEPASPAATSARPSAAPPVPPVDGRARTLDTDQLCAMLQPEELPFGETPPEPRPGTTANGTATCEWRGKAVSLAITFDTDFAGITATAAGQAEFVELAKRQVRVDARDGGCGAKFNRSYGGMRIEVTGRARPEEPACDLAKRTAETLVPRFPLAEPDPAAPGTAPAAGSLKAPTLCRSVESAVRRADLNEIGPLEPADAGTDAPAGSVRCATTGESEPALSVTVRRELPLPVSADTTEPDVNGRTVRTESGSHDCTFILPKEPVTVAVRAHRSIGEAPCETAGAVATELDKSLR